MLPRLSGALGGHIAGSICALPAGSEPSPLYGHHDSTKKTASALLKRRPTIGQPGFLLLSNQVLPSCGQDVI
jgi:hypothetical protein